MYEEYILNGMWLPYEKKRKAAEEGTVRTEPEFLNIYWRLESRLFATSCLFKGQRVQQGSYKLHFLLNDKLKKFIAILTDLKSGWNPIITVFFLKKYYKIKLKPCTRTFSWIAFQNVSEFGLWLAGRKTAQEKKLKENRRYYYYYT
jgi:hypothetical protein